MEIACLVQDAKVLGPTSPVNLKVAVRIASAILSNYSLTSKRES